MENTQSQQFSDYGEYDVSNKIELNLPKTEIKIEKKENRFSYYRKNSENQEFRKSIPTERDTIQIELAPVLPLNLPAKKTNDLMFLRIKESVFIEKRSTSTIFIQFPIEIGVFLINSDGSKDFFDCFTCEPMHPRFALYGTTEQGKLCMYGKISLLEKSEKPQPYVFAKMKAIITNELDEGANIGKIVFPATHHSMYYLEKSPDAHIDDISVKIKKEPIGNVVEIEHVEYSDRDTNWKLAPMTGSKTEMKKFTMEKGFN